MLLSKLNIKAIFCFIVVLSSMLMCDVLSAQSEPTIYSLDRQTLRLSRSLKRHLSLEQDEMCDIQLILFDHFIAFYESGNTATDSLQFKDAQRAALNDVEKVLSLEQREKFEPIKEFYINATVQEKKMQRRLNIASRNYDNGKIIDISKKIQKKKSGNGQKKSSGN